MGTCARCRSGELKVIATGFYGNSLVVHCQNPDCDLIYEEDISKDSGTDSQTGVDLNKAEGLGSGRGEDRAQPASMPPVRL